ncbi:MAG: ATP-dependent DNA helicase RecG [Desulfitobacteriaceae bacterium]
MNTLRIVLDNLQRALRTEEKQGFINTGVMGGFHAFLSGVVPRLEQLLPQWDLGVLRQIAGKYPTSSPLKRREMIWVLQRNIQNLQDSLEQDEGPLNHSSPSGRERRLDELVLAPESVLIPRKESSGEPEDSKDSRALREMEDFREMGDSRQEYSKYPVEDKGLLRQRSGQPEVGRSTRMALQYVKGVGPERIKQLHNLGIKTVEDLLLYFPRRYEDRHLLDIAELQDGVAASVAGRVVSGQIIQGKMKVVKLSVEQNGRMVQAVWFNQPYILKQYPTGTRVMLTGKVRRQRYGMEILVSDIEKMDQEIEILPDAGGIAPVYSETARLSSKVIRGILLQVVDQTEGIFPEFLSPSDLGEWLERPKAYREIHSPSSHGTLAKARERLVWEEILFLQLAVARLRHNIQKTSSPALTGDGSLVKTFVQALSFELTNAQERVIREILRDIARTQGMTRLVQGDVGSGKTVVAMVALLEAVASGYQGAMMAPTEILALQHYQSLSKAFASLGVNVVLLLGSQGKAQREEILSQIASGQAQVVVGTHALIQESVVFHSLGLAVTDEQHRFGVRQRSLLQSKGKDPHVLVLTATPIPRTLALTLYGDLQLSVIDEMPAGRKPIITRKLTERGRPNLEKFMESQIGLGRQIYVVCPLVQESETLDLVSAQERAAYLGERFSHWRVALLHGRMKGSEKEEIMRDFQSGAIHILVSTTVVEVGVNVPNASIMVIEGAERFGLAQLHQLRGRVGRGTDQSYCILMSEAHSSRRLDVLCQTQDGFQIAEEDLRLRGPGELLGTRQHGLPELRLADLSRDGRLVEKAYQFAQRVLQEPDNYSAVLEEAKRFYKPDTTGIN